MSLTTTERGLPALGLARAVSPELALVFVGLYIRMGVLETPVFAQAASRKAESERTPVARRCCASTGAKSILTALLRTGQQTPFYIFTTYVLTYAHAATRARAAASS